MRRREARSLEQQRQGFERPQHAQVALGAAETRKETDLGLGQAEQGARVVGRDAAMAGEADLEPAAECRAVNRCDKGLFGGLDPPKQAMNIHESVEEAAAPLPFDFPWGARQHRFEPIEIGTGDESGFAAGDDDTLGLRVG